MKISDFEIPGLKLIELEIFRDERGFFVERFRAEKMAAAGIPIQFCQDNHSNSLPGVLRGLHYQQSQGKLVGVTRGRIWDVAVDLRPESPTYLKHVALELSGDNGRLIWIPPGFAHGFCVLGNEPADLVYKVDRYWQPSEERGVHFADPTLDISWPIDDPIVSERDRNLAMWKDQEYGVGVTQ